MLVDALFKGVHIHANQHNTKLFCDTFLKLIFAKRGGSWTTTHLYVQYTFFTTLRTCEATPKRTVLTLRLCREAHVDGQRCFVRLIPRPSEQAGQVMLQVPSTIPSPFLVAETITKFCTYDNYYGRN